MAPRKASVSTPKQSSTKAIDNDSGVLLELDGSTKSKQAYYIDNMLLDSSEDKDKASIMKKRSKNSNLVNPGKGLAAVSGDQNNDLTFSSRNASSVNRFLT